MLFSLFLLIYFGYALCSVDIKRIVAEQEEYQRGIWVKTLGII